MAEKSQVCGCFYLGWIVSFIELLLDSRAGRDWYWVWMGHDVSMALRGREHDLKRALMEKWV